MSAINEYKTLALELSKLIDRGDGDSEEADAIRDKMDQLWYLLSETEIDTLRRCVGGESA
jgi:hypothetical protein